MQHPCRQFYQNVLLAQYYTTPKPSMPSWIGISTPMHQLSEISILGFNHEHAEEPSSLYGTPAGLDSSPSWYSLVNSNEAVFMNPLLMPTLESPRLVHNDSSFPVVDLGLTTICWGEFSDPHLPSSQLGSDDALYAHSLRLGTPNHSIEHPERARSLPDLEIETSTLPSRASTPLAETAPAYMQLRYAQTGPDVMSSVETCAGEPSEVTTASRSEITAAKVGTYSCTYHGCTLRFETRALLQEHKRKIHQLAKARNSHHGPPTFISQVGPHRCDIINPKTRKPCNTVFSRPYELTRHEDTIHNTRKHKIQCVFCAGRTFSRADALRRHYLKCHSDKEFPNSAARRCK
ncbi:hypothetical protein F5Y16DRAFT_387611 [Xylariaceae sp. FL0255]|nr:hypothetical protein F5Y16DRAFT_387611 [Xylariaceae sp. FL0255]